MPYRLKSCESVPEGIKRVVDEQIERAIKELTDRELDRHESVHQARKRFKKIRGVLRLVRAELGEIYTDENAWFRDTGRELSAVRDAEAMLETLDKLRDCYAEQLKQDTFRDVQEALRKRRQALVDEELELDAAVQEIVSRLQEAGQRVQSWPLMEEGFAALGPGLQKVFSRGRRGLVAAYGEPTVENFHEWRKRVKYHWYHCRLLREVWSDLMDGYCKSLKRLSDLLGDDHDLAILRQTLLAQPEAFGSKHAIQVLLGIIESRQGDLRAQAEILGQRVYAEKSKRFHKRMARYWEAWRTEAQRSNVAVGEALV
jgi:CHAD domain-containing protein